MSLLKRTSSKFNPFILFIVVAGVVAIGYFVYHSFAASTQTIFKPSAAATVSQLSPTTANPNPATLKINGGSASLGDTEHSFLKFTVNNLSGPVTSAQLRLFTTSANSAGYTVKSVTSNNWDPNSVTYNTAPSVGGDIGTAGAFAANTWTTVDVTSLITGNGTYSLALWPRNTAESTFAGFGTANAPQLVVNTNVTTAAAPQAYFIVPTNTQTISGSSFQVNAFAHSTLPITHVVYQYAAGGQSLQQIADVASGPFGAPFNWDTTKIPNGTYALKATAYDSLNQPGSVTIFVTINNSTSTPPPPSGVTRAAFYYPWFPGAWNQQGLNPFTHYHPTLGFYSSSDNTVIAKHIAAMQYAGLNAGIASWWGQNSSEDQVVGQLLQQAAGTGFKWSLYYECEGNNTGGTCSTFSPSVSQITSDLNYIKGKYASNDNYLKINNKPVIFVYGDSTDSCTTASNWKQANANVGNAFYVVLKVFNGYASCAAQPDNWHQYGPASAEDHQAGHSFAISPGFWKANETTPRLARDLNRWNTNISDMVNSKEPLQLVTTFNEWGEGSAIESASEWASSSGYGQYIDALHNKLVGTCTSNCGTQATVGLSPANNATVSGSVDLAAVSNNLAGAARADFYIDGSLIGSDTTPNPTALGVVFNQTWNASAASVGNHSFKAVVTGSNNVTAETSETLVVQAANYVVGLAPANNTTVSGTVTLGVDTSMSNAVKADFYIDNNLIGTDSSVTISAIGYVFQQPWNTANASAGSHTFKAVVTGPGGVTAQNSETLNVAGSTACALSPSAPTNLKASLASSSDKTVNLSWTAPAAPPNCHITNYLITRTPQGGQPTSFATNNTATSFSDTGTNFSTAYSYQVLAVDEKGFSPNSSSASVTTPTLTTPDTQAPDVPSGLKITIVSPTQVTVSWNASADNPKTGGATGTAGYKVFRNGTLITSNGVATTSVNDNFSFASGQAYSWTVEAYDAANPPNVSAQSAPVSATPNPNVVATGPCGTKAGTKPTYTKVVWLWGENTGYGTLSGMSYLNSLAQACGTDPQYLDNMFGGNDQVSEPHYIAATGGSNCNTGLTPLSGSTGCRTGDSDPSSSGTNTISSIFSQINHKTGLSWKAYEEGMPGNCSSGSSGNYATKHNPPPFFTQLINDGSCAKFDVPFPSINCTSSGCPAAPASVLTSDIDNGTLPSFSFITPNLCNDMHGGSNCGSSSAIMDQWLRVYLARILNGPDYKNGRLAIFIGWDESSPNQPQPNVIIAPSINKSKPTTTINHFAMLRTTEQMLGLPGLDGCASGQTPGNIGSCPAGSTVDLRALFNF